MHTHALALALALSLALAPALAPVPAPAPAPHLMCTSPHLCTAHNPKTSLRPRNSHVQPSGISKKTYATTAATATTKGAIQWNHSNG